MPSSAVSRRARASAGSSAPRVTRASRDDALIVPIGTEDIPGLVAFVEREKIDLTIVGPEGPSRGRPCRPTAGAGLRGVRARERMAPSWKAPKPSPSR